VTVVAASGDIGAVAEPCDVYAALTGTGTFTPVREVNLLASDPLVLGAGGTSLTASHITGCLPGIRWRVQPPVSRPGYQDGVPAITATRGVPDVSADASGHADLAMVLREGGWSMIRDGGAPAPAHRSGPR
jgi:subtilase family serine protease